MQSSMQSRSMSNISDDDSSMMSSDRGSVGMAMMSAAPQMAMMSAAPQMAMACESSSSSSYYSKPEFRDIVNGIKSNGVMSDKMLNYVTAYSFSEMIKK